MSWFARSIANTLQLNVDDDEDDEQHNLNNNNNTNTHVSTDQNNEQQLEEDDSPLTPGRGVKEDLSEITKTLTRQFWGVASFLAPPPPADAEESNEQSDSSDPEDDAPEAISGIRRDFAEIGGRFRSGISKLSTNIDVSEITKLASNFLQLSPDGEAIGVTDEVVAFVRDITMHPETWLDFPLPDDEDDDEDFELSDAQQEHALAVESVAPRLAALRIELCPSYMSEGSFWKIYFVLLHPRLDPKAAELLSTPEIVKARAALRHELKDRSTSQTKEPEQSTNSFPYSEQKPESSDQQHPSVPPVTQPEPMPPNTSSTQSASEKHQIPTEEIQVIDKSVIQEEPQTETKTKTKTEDYQNIIEEEDKDDDDWLKEEEEDTSENITGTTATATSTTNTMTTTTIPIENDEDVSFSDLEEDDDAPTSYKKSDGSNDWLDVDDIDVA